MTSGTYVNLSKLRTAINLCLDALERDLGPDVELGADYYWLLEFREVFDLSSQPLPNAGQLSDDISELDAALADPDEIEVVPWHVIGHIIGPLQRLAALTLP